MFPPTNGPSLNVEAISGILGSISIACWVVVFSPQIIENFRRSSAEGLSIEFVIIWLAGDVFNILGAILQGVLPTMIILAIYYTIADIVLLGQCFYYRGFSWRDPRPDEDGPQNKSLTANENTPLLIDGSQVNGINGTGIRNQSPSTFRDRLASLDATYLSPAIPMHPPPKSIDQDETPSHTKPRSWTQAILFNATVIVLVIVAGVLGYFLSPADPNPSGEHKNPADAQKSALSFNTLGQVFGYICAILYLGSRIPQLLLNHRRKSTEGLNVLFFLFACIGNLTYVLSIFAFEPICSRHRHGHWHESTCRPGEARATYARYILVNLSWLLGSLGTLFLDFAVFAQFFIYRQRGDTAVSTQHEDGRGRSVAS